MLFTNSIATLPGQPRRPLATVVVAVAMNGLGSIQDLGADGRTKSSSSGRKNCQADRIVNGNHVLSGCYYTLFTTTPRIFTGRSNQVPIPLDDGPYAETMEGSTESKL